MALAFDCSDVRLYALHRMAPLILLTSHATVPVNHWGDLDV